MKAQAIGRIAVKSINGMVDFVVLTIIVLLSGFAGYALWDSKQIFQAADKSNYAVYKPTEADEGKSFKELQAINSEVFAWLNVYGTHIDYPVTQGPDNMKYVNTNAEGQYSLSGAIFLHSSNSKDFSDFNSILFGHHMEQKAMFGEIGDFLEKDKFDAHRFGNLYFDGMDHGIEFFAFIHTDAYDSSVFTADVSDARRQEYLDGLLDKAIHIRNIDVTIDDRIVLLSTCSSSSTNGRDILVGRLSDSERENPFMTAEETTDSTKIQMSVDGQGGYLDRIPTWMLKLALAVAVLLIVIALAIQQTRRKERMQKENGHESGHDNGQDSSHESGQDSGQDNGEENSQDNGHESGEENAVNGI